MEDFMDQDVELQEELSGIVTAVLYSNVENGYTVLRLGEDHATATLHQSDFFFNYPLKEGDEKPLQWSLLVENNDGQECSFAYRRPA